MSKKAIFIQLGIIIFAAPLLALAATASFSGSVTGTTTSVAMPPVATPPIVVVGPISAPGPRVCPPFTRSLSIGATGSDVTALQDYLGAQGYLNVSSTGYFGVLTRAAVGKWQAANSVAALGASGSGIFGPLSRASFMRSCGSNNGETFSANPQSGIAPLTVQFVATAPQGADLGNAVNFGDGATGTLGFVPVCSSCNAEGVVSHTYTATGTYTATLTSGVCSCPADGICNCPAIRILGTATVVVGPANTTSTGPVSTSSIQQLNAPGVVTLSLGSIAEIRNESAYFTLTSIASGMATIQITPVGCWNSFPSDPAPRVVCMIALVPIPPQTFTVGETYVDGNYSITLTQLGSGTATFSLNTN